MKLKFVSSKAFRIKEHHFVTSPFMGGKLGGHVSCNRRCNAVWRQLLPSFFDGLRLIVRRPDFFTLRGTGNARCRFSRLRQSVLLISMLEIFRTSSPAQGVLFQFIKPQFINNPVNINDLKTLLLTHSIHSMYVQLDQFYQFRPHGRDT